MYCWTFGSIQYTEMDTCLIGDSSTNAIKCINLT
ncbi:unnamed protein product [Candida parapsilosis]